MEIDSGKLEARVALEALDPAFRIVLRNAITNVLLPVAVAAVFWSQIAHGIVIGWLGLFLTLLAIKYRLAVAYTKQDVPCSDVALWGRRLSVATLLTSLLWASTAFLFYVEGSVEYQLFLFIVLNALSIGAAIAGLYWLPLFYLRAGSITGALAVRLALEGTFAYITLAVILLAGLAGMTAIAKTLNRTMRSEIRQRYESDALNAELHAKTLEAQQATMAKSRFLAAASHDLRQPLHALALFIDVLKEEENEAERKMIMPRIELSLDALRKLFDALLDVSRLDANVITPKYSHFDLSDLLKSLAGEFRAAATAKGLELRVHAVSSIVVSDRLLLERILRNLIGNAIRYTESGGILLSARQRGDSVLLQVWDTGVGIPDESRDEVFDEFLQLHNAHRDRDQGLGLGLSIVKRLCLLLNHRLELRSCTGKGSVFSVRITRGSKGMLAANAETAAPHSWDLSGRRILVIDDERDILDAMQTLLSKWGCEVIVAESLKDAVTALNTRGVVPDLIMSDLRLRDDDTGVQAMDRLREQFGPSISGILVTGDTAAEQIKLARQSGYELLQKPVRPIRLRALLHQY